MNYCQQQPSSQQHLTHFWGRFLCFVSFVASTQDGWHFFEILCRKKHASFTHALDGIKLLVHRVDFSIPFSPFFAKDLSNMDRDSLVYMAKLAEQAER